MASSKPRLLHNLTEHERVKNYAAKQKLLIHFQAFLSIFLPFPLFQRQGLKLCTVKETFSLGTKLYRSKMVLHPLVTFLCHLESKISQPEAISSAIYTLRKLIIQFLHYFNLFSSGIKINLTVEVWVAFLIKENHHNSI